MKNRRIIMRYMRSKENDYRFSINELADGAGLKKPQIDYEIKLMVNASIVEKIVDVNDLRRAYYIQGENFDRTWETS